MNMGLVYDKGHSDTVIATAVMKGFRFAGRNGAYATSALSCQGITEADVTVGGLVSVVDAGSYPVEAAGPIAVGDEVGPATDGTGRALANATGGVCGWAKTAAGSAGEKVVVVMQQPRLGAAQLGALLVVACLAGDPSKADANTAAIQAGIDAAALVGTAATEVRVHAPGGGCYISRTVEPWGLVALKTTPGTAFKRITTHARNWNMVRPRQTQSQFRVDGAAIVGGFITIIEPGHTKKEGDQVFTGDFLGNATLNGPKVAVNVVPGISWQFAAAGANPTNTAVQMAQASPYQPVAGNSFSRVGGVVTVSGPAVAGHRRQAGDAIWVANVPVVGASFNGAFEVTDVIPGVSYSYANAGPDEIGTGTAHVLGEHMLDIDVCLDGSNSLGGPYAYIGTPANGCQFGNVGILNVTIREAVGTFGGRVCNYFNVGNVRVSHAVARKNCSVNQQFDSFCRKIVVDYANSEGTNDDNVAYGVTDFGTYSETVPPCGPGDNGYITVGTLRGSSATGLFKMYCAAGYTLGHIQLLGCYGKGSVSVGDPGVGVSGGGFLSLTTGPLRNVPTGLGNVIGCSNSTAFSSWGDVYIDELVDNNQGAVNAANGGEAMFFTGPFKRVRIGRLIGKVARTDSGTIKMSPTVTAGTSLSVGYADTVGSGVAGVSHGLVFLARGNQPVAQLSVDQWFHKGTAANVGHLIRGDGGSAWQNISLGIFRGNSFGALFNVGAGTAGQTHTITVQDFEADTIGQVVGSDNTGTYNVNVRRGKATTVTNNVLQFFLAGQTCNFQGDIEHPAGKLLLATAGPTYRINSRTCPFDAGAAGLALAPAAFDEICNTGATFNGATGAGRYIRNAANSAWVKVA